jgi:molybdate transport system substrate-binding protein
VDVYAAASLGEVMGDLQAEFQRQHPALLVRLNLGASSTLVTQIRNGAPADVFVSADESNMAKAVDAGLTDGEAQGIARNALSIIVAPGNPKGIKGLRDLSRPDVVTALGGPEVPVGKYARTAFAKAGVPVPQGSNELDVKQIVTRVTLGEADAGVVYVSDVLAAKGKGEGIVIPPEHNVEAAYPAAVLKEGGNVPGARIFLTFLSSDFAQRTLSEHGLLPAEAVVR